MISFKTVFAGLLATALASPALTQAPRYDVKTINFDLWCQEQAKLPPDRCDKRLPDDEKLFETYRAKIEKYEVPYLQRREEQQQLNRTILHNDPIDNPIDQSPTGSSQTTAPTDNAQQP